MKTSQLLGATALAGVLLLTPVCAMAQDEPAPGGQDTVADEPASGEEEAIVIVGSRIRRPDKFNSADPVQVITRDEATQAGFNSTAEILQSNAVTGGTDQINDAYGGFVINGGPGVNTVSLRGLGTTRTLVLLNGRRVAPAGSRGSVGSADLNVLPNAMIDRVEVLNTGASSIYGSDAVAGVINIVTRTHVEGIMAEAQHNVTDEGGGNSRRYSLTGGFNTNGFRVAASLEYYKRDTLSIGQRDWASCPTNRWGTNGSDFGAADYVDPRTGKPKCFTLENNGVTINTIGTPNFAGSTGRVAPGAPAGYTGTCNRYRPSAGATGAVPGYECVGGGTLSTNIRDTSSINHLKEDLLSPAEVYTAYGQAAYDSDILGNAEFYVDVLFNRRKSSQAQQRQFTIDYPYGSPLIPPELRYGTTFLAAGGAAAGAPAIGIRVFADYGIYDNYQTVDYSRVNGGVRGDLPAGWRYDLFLGKSWSDASYTSDLILTNRFWASMDVVASGTGFACRVQPNPGCVAAPPLTPALVGGDFRNTAWFDWVTAPITGNTKFVESTVNLTVDGPLFRLPGGQVQVALGVEYRKSSIDDTPADDSINGNLYGFTSSTPTRGSDSVWEAFGEIEVPIVTNDFLYNFTLNGSGRYTEYASYGGDYTYKVGGILSPVKGLSARGSYGTSYRAPALYEQFLGATSGFLANTGDPCNDIRSDGNPLVVERCKADGLPIGSVAGATPGRRRVPSEQLDHRDRARRRRGRPECGDVEGADLRRGARAGVRRVVRRPVDRGRLLLDQGEQRRVAALGGPGAVAVLRQPAAHHLRHRPDHAQPLHRAGHGSAPRGPELREHLGREGRGYRLYAALLARSRAGPGAPRRAADAVPVALQPAPADCGGPRRDRPDREPGMDRHVRRPVQVGRLELPLRRGVGRCDRLDGLWLSERLCDHPLLPEDAGLLPPRGLDPLRDEGIRPDAGCSEPVQHRTARHLGGIHQPDRQCAGV
ncbi:MAG: TonB-dependent receptor [Sphingomonas sp.]